MRVLLQSAEDALHTATSIEDAGHTDDNFCTIVDAAAALKALDDEMHDSDWRDEE